MSIIELLILAAGLSMDAFAVSLSNGMCYKNIRVRETVLIAFMFGFFQAAMPVIGFIGGSLFLKYIEKFDHWIAVTLLCFLGGKMFLEGISHRGETCPVENILTFRQLLFQAVATSVDALAVGLTLAAIKVPLVLSAAVIGSVTFLLCVPAVIIGKKSGSALGGKAEIAGGLILAGIGIKILISHLTGG